MNYRRILKRCLYLLLAALLLVGTGAGGLAWYLHPKLSEERRIPYGERAGQPLMMQILRPAQAPRRSKALVLMVSGSWKSKAEGVPRWISAPFLRRGFTVFAVSHVSQPKASVMEIVSDVHRAVRFIRHHAAEYDIDPARIGVTGASSGGHLSLMLATQAGLTDSAGPPGPAVAEGSDPAIDRQSSRVQAAAVFFPVTDLINLGDSTENLRDGGPPKHFVHSFGPDGQNLEKWPAIGGFMSPIQHITPALPPVLIHHGDADTLVPLDQSTRFQKAAADAGAPPVEVVVRRGKAHGWATILWDMELFSRWMDQKLDAVAPTAALPGR
jgi:acetyl esterase/lipase